MMITLTALLIAAAQPLPVKCEGCCIRYGVPAVCRSPALEERARRIIYRSCRRPCDRQVINAWIETFQGPRGPQESAQALAAEVLGAMRRFGQ